MLKKYFENYGHNCKAHLTDPFYKYKVNKTRFRLWFMKNSTISPKYILLRSHPRSFAKLRGEIIDQLENYPYILHPFSSITFYCELFWMVLIFIYLIIIPLDVYKNIDPKMPRKPEYLEMLLASITIVDIFRRFFTGYLIHGRDSDKIVLEFRKISFHYFKEFFLIDLIASLAPFIELGVLQSPNYFLAIELFSYLRFFRLASMLRIFKNVMIFYRYNENIAEILEGINILWFSAHWVSCFSVLVLIVEHRFDASIFQWYSDILTTDVPLIQQYIISFHRSISILSGTGFKMLHINKSINEMIFTIFMTILGYILTVVIFARIFVIVTGLMSASSKYEEMLHEVSQYIALKKLKKSTKGKIKTYYDYKYEHSYFSENLILLSIPESLKQSILIEGAKLLMDNIYFFKKLPIPIAANIVSHFAHEIVLAGDVIFKTGEKNNATYFLLRGTVAEFTESGRETLHIEDGSQFGEGIYIDTREKHTLSAVAIETCELYKLNSENMLDLVNYCPDLLERASKEAIDRRILEDTIDERYLQLQRKHLSLVENLNFK